MSQRISRTVVHHPAPVTVNLGQFAGTLDFYVATGISFNDQLKIVFLYQSLIICNNERQCEDCVTFSLIKNISRAKTFKSVGIVCRGAVVLQPAFHI